MQDRSPFHLIFRTPLGQYRANHYGILENSPVDGLCRVIGCIDVDVFEGLDGFGRNEQQLLMNTEHQLREKTYLVLQIGNSSAKDHRRSYTVIPEIIDRIIIEYHGQNGTKP